MARVLIQWHGLAPDDTSWEDVAQLIIQYHSLDVEDKVTFYEEGIIKLPVKIVNKGESKLNTCGGY